MFIPVMGSFVAGQDITFVLLAAALAIEAMRRDRDVLAGLLFALCSVKVHLFLLLPVALLLHKRWRVLGGGVLGGVTFMTASFVTDGLDWPVRYVRMLANPKTHPGADVTPSLRSLVYAFTASENLVTEIVLSLAVAAMVIVIAKRSSLELAIGFSLIGGLLVSYHAFIHDCLILLLPMALILEHSKWPPLRASMALTIMPPLFFCLMAGHPWSALLPLALMIILVLAAVRPAGTDARIA
jgi:hypothetical protein